MKQHNVIQGSPEWARLFTYDEKTGEIRNKVHRNARSKAGEKVGWVSQGYLVTTIRKKKHRVHRIVWEMHRGPIPSGMEIDHINRNRRDNRIENMRLANRHEQNLNLSPRQSGSGVTGVVFNKKDKRWQAQIGFKKKHIYLGQFLTQEAAISARRKAESQLGFRGNAS